MIRYGLAIYLGPYAQSPQKYINEPACQPPYFHLVGQASRDNGRGPPGRSLCGLQYWGLRDIDDFVWKAIPKELSFELQRGYFGDRQAL